MNKTHYSMCVRGKVFVAQMLSTFPKGVHIFRSHKSSARNSVKAPAEEIAESTAFWLCNLVTAQPGDLAFQILRLHICKWAQASTSGFKNQMKQRM